MFFSQEPSVTTTQFDMQHFFALAVVIAFIILVFINTERLIKWRYKNQFRVLLGVFLLLLDFAFYVWKWNVGLQLIFPIPMHICSWATYFVAAALITNNIKVFQVSLYYGITGGILSLLVPDFGGYGDKSL